MVRLVFCCNEPLIEFAVRHIIESTEGFSLVRVVSRADELAAAVLQELPDIVLVCPIPRLDWGVVTEIRRQCPQSKVVLFLNDLSPEIAHQAVECGVRGILRRTDSAELFVKCLLKVHEGELWFEKAVVATFLEGHAIQLSRRESQLVALVSSGLRNREIADTLGISEGTVKVYLSRLFLKVGAKDRFELALYGTRNLSPTAPPEEPSGFALKSIFVPKGSKSPGRGFSDAAAGPARDR